MHRGAPCRFAGAFRAHEPGVRLVWMRQAEAPFRWPLGLTVHRDIACKNNSRLRLWVKSSLGLLRWQDRHRDGVLLDAADLQHERGRCNLVFHGLAEAVAIGGATEGLWLEKMSVLHHVDPAACGQADRVDAGFRCA